MCAGFKKQLQRILARPEIKDALWAHLKRGSAGTVCDPDDGTFIETILNAAWFKKLQQTPKDPNNPDGPTWCTRPYYYELVIQLFHDDYQPFEKTSYSTGAIMASIVLLPPHQQRLQKNIIVAALIPGIYVLLLLALGNLVVHVCLLDIFPVLLYMNVSLDDIS